MVKYTWVNREDCISCGACATVAPDIYDLDRKSLAEVIYKGDGNRGVVEIPEHLYDELMEAKKTCPTSSVKVADVPFNE